MRWPFGKRSALEPCFPIESYSIDKVIDRHQRFVPLSPTELVALNRAMQFEGEEILHAPDADFMGLRWDTVLGTVDGAIYKIAIQWIGPRDQAGRAYRELAIYCTQHYGKGESGAMALWDASDGNIVLDMTNVGEEAILNVFLTSRKVRQFRRL